MNFPIQLSTGFGLTSEIRSESVLQPPALFICRYGTGFFLACQLLSACQIRYRVLLSPCAESNRTPQRYESCAPPWSYTGDCYVYCILPAICCCVKLFLADGQRVELCCWVLEAVLIAGSPSMLVICLLRSNTPVKKNEKCREIPVIFPALTITWF